MRYKRLWTAMALVVVASFAVLGYYGWRLYQVAPPVPDQIVTESGKVLFTGAEIKEGQNVWQSMGGQEVGSIWGHGAYLAPDWSADWLHREAVFLLDKWGNQKYGKSYEELDAIQQAEGRATLQQELRKNTYDPDTKTLTVSDLRAAAIDEVGAHYNGLFGDDPAVEKLRDEYSIPVNAIPNARNRHLMEGFFFWSSWACVTDRPGENGLSYTSNWPSEPLVGNTLTGDMVVWSVISFVLLLAGIGALAWYYATLRREDEEPEEYPETDPLLAANATPSMKATLKYFWVVGAMLVAQIALGAATAHYSVEGNSFYGIPLADILPYAVTRAWHTQLGIFWIATAWLATGLFMAPAVSEHEPKYQKLGVNLLFVCLLVIVAGSLFGEWLGIQQRLGHGWNFWFGTQGLEYVDLGRFWQIFLFVGLFLWLGLMVRALLPAFKHHGQQKHLLGLFLLSSAAIALFWGAGLMWGRQSNLAIIEYWRWWVVHLWVEGFFEVFATVIMAFLFTRMGLVRGATATASVLFATTIFLSGGIIGTFHHLYFTGTPTAVLAFGAVFSALEVVPLALMGFEAYGDLSKTHIRPWVTAYRWPIYFFVAVAFWNLVGAGLLGFLINPPVALYYMQGLNTTAAHGHGALFGVYGLLGIGLMLFCLKGLFGRRKWKTGVLGFSFWAMNIGLMLMLVLTLVPIGLLQTVASVNHGLWYARSAEFMQTPLIQNLHWMRILGDTIFALGAFAMGWFVTGLKFGWSFDNTPDNADAETIKVV